MPRLVGLSPRAVLGPYVPPTPPPSDGIILLGGRTTYGNSGNTENALITGWGGNPSYSVLLEYFNQASAWGTWGASGSANVWNAAGGWAPGFTTWSGPKCVALPLQVTNTPRVWADITGGSQDSNLEQMFTYLYSIACQYIRPGWEVNNPYSVSGAYAWACGPGGSAADISANQLGYVATVTHIKAIGESLYPGYFQYLFNVSGGQFPNGPNFVPEGPYDWGADGYLLDVYNTYYDGSTWPGDSTMQTNLESGNQPNWDTFSTYCVANNKIIGFGELGPQNGTPNGGDDPTFWAYTFNLCLAAAEAGIPAWYLPWNSGGNASPPPASAVAGNPDSMSTITILVASAIADGWINGPSGSPLVITAVPAQTATVGDEYEYQLESTGGSGGNSFTAGPLPSGITVTTGGLMSGTPSVTLNETVDAQVTDSDGATSPTTFNFTVNASGAPVPTVPGGFVVPTTVRMNENFDTTTLNPDYWAVVDGGPVQNGTPTWAYNTSMANPSVGLELTCNGSTGALITSLGSVYGGGDADFTFSPAGGGTVPATGPVFIEYSGYVPPMPSNGEKVNYWPSFWMSTGGDSWPTYGEIDAMEGLTYNAVHCHGSSDDNLGGVDPPAGSNSASPGTHTYGVLWTTSEVIFFVDGDFIIPGNQAASTVAATVGLMGNLPQCILLQNSGSASTTPGSSGTSVIEVRYVRVWQ